MKKAALTAVQLLACAGFAFAQNNSGIPALDTWGENILGLISSNWVKAICALGFAVEAGAMIWAGRQGESGAVKKFIPWMIGTVGLLTASSITDFFFTANA